MSIWGWDSLSYQVAEKAREFTDPEMRELVYDIASLINDLESMNHGTSMMTSTWNPCKPSSRNGSKMTAVNGSRDTSIRDWKRQEIFYIDEHNCFREAELSATPPKPRSVYELKEGDMCWWVCEDGDVVNVRFRHPYDIRKVKQGNAFMTEEEAEAESERRLIRQIMRKFGGRDKTKTYHDWVIAINQYTDLIETAEAGYEDIVPLAGIFFKNQEDANKALKEIGWSRIRKAFIDEE